MGLFCSGAGVGKWVQVVLGIQGLYGFGIGVISHGSLQVCGALRARHIAVESNINEL